MTTSGPYFLSFTGYRFIMSNGSSEIWWLVRYPDNPYPVTELTDVSPSGITIGAVVVPQGMAYAILAKLAPQFGLYSSFMGVLIYWFFATSKDITIGVC